MSSSDLDLADFWERQQRLLIDTLAPLVEGAAQLAYIDYPVHSNIGDQLIYLGTEVWLKTVGIPVLGRWNLYNFGSRRLPDKTVVLLHGGGNFGDLYGHQAFREDIVKHHPKHRIVILPQTVWFDSVEAIETARSVLNRHLDLHILLRDRASLDFVSSEFNATYSYLTPDMAVFLHPVYENLVKLHRPVGARVPLMCLLRKDREAATDSEQARKDCSWTGDWRDLGRSRHYRLKLWNLAARIMCQDRLAEAFSDHWYETAQQAAGWAATRIASAERLRTSRLHGHILATLLGIESELLDNSYGKNSAYFEAWHKPLETSGLARLVTSQV